MTSKYKLKIPGELYLPVYYKVKNRPYTYFKADKFYDPRNIAYLEKIVKDYEEGKVELVQHDLIEID